MALTVDSEGLSLVVLLTTHGIQHIWSHMLGSQLSQKTPHNQTLTVCRHTWQWVPPALIPRYSISVAQSPSSLLGLVLHSVHTMIQNPPWSRFPIVLRSCRFPPPIATADTPKRGGTAEVGKGLHTASSTASASIQCSGGRKKSGHRGTQPALSLHCSGQGGNLSATIAYEHLATLIFLCFPQKERGQVHGLGGRHSCAPNEQAATGGSERTAGKNQFSERTHLALIVNNAMIFDHEL